MKKQLSVVSEQSSVKSIFFWVAFLLVTCHLSLVTSYADEVSRIEDTYKGITDIKGSFIQKSFIKDLKRTDTYKGVFFIKRPSKMRWEYKGEKPQEIIINNEIMLIYNKAQKQAFKGAFNKQKYGQAPIALLSGFGNIKDEFNVNEKDNKLLLTPKIPMGSVVTIEIETSAEGFPVKSFVIKDTRSNRIEISLKDVEINSGIKDSVFDLFLSGEVGVYEYNP